MLFFGFFRVGKVSIEATLQIYLQKLPIMRTRPRLSDEVTR